MAFTAVAIANWLGSSQEVPHAVAPVLRRVGFFFGAFELSWLSLRTIRIDSFSPAVAVRPWGTLKERGSGASAIIRKERVREL